MAKKSNKTEHVLRLITKNEDAIQEDDYFDIDQDIYENGTSAIRKAVRAGSDESAEEAGSKPDDLKKLTTEKAGPAAPAAPVNQQPPAGSAAAAQQAAEPVEARPKEQSSAEPPAAPVTAAAQQGSPLVRAFREQENSQSAVPNQSGGLVNIAEILAREKIVLVMERMKVCTCRTCYNDVLALTLNALPTKYVAANTGNQYFQRAAYKEKYETDILAALTKACVRVKASPRH